MPAECLGQKAARKEPERATRDRDEDVGTHRARPCVGLGELRDNDRQDHRRLCGSADALQEASGDKPAGARGRAAEDRGQREDHDAGEEDSLSAEQVAQTAGEQQEAPEGDQEAVHDPGQVGL